MKLKHLLIGIWLFISAYSVFSIVNLECNLLAVIVAFINIAILLVVTIKLLIEDI